MFPYLWQFFGVGRGGIIFSNKEAFQSNNKIVAAHESLIQLYESTKVVNENCNFWKVPLKRNLWRDDPHPLCNLSATLATSHHRASLCTLIPQCMGWIMEVLSSCLPRSAPQPSISHQARELKAPLYSNNQWHPAGWLLSVALLLTHLIRQLQECRTGRGDQVGQEVASYL